MKRTMDSSSPIRQITFCLSLGFLVLCPLNALSCCTTNLISNGSSTGNWSGSYLSLSDGSDATYIYATASGQWQNLAMTELTGDIYGNGSDFGNYRRYSRAMTVNLRGNAGGGSPASYKLDVLIFINGNYVSSAGITLVSSINDYSVTFTTSSYWTPGQIDNFYVLLMANQSFSGETWIRIHEMSVDVNLSETKRIFTCGPTGDPLNPCEWSGGGGCSSTNIEDYYVYYPTANPDTQSDECCEAVPGDEGGFLDATIADLGCNNPPIENIDVWIYAEETNTDVDVLPVRITLAGEKLSKSISLSASPSWYRISFSCTERPSPNAGVLWTINEVDNMMVRLTAPGDLYTYSLKVWAMYTSIYHNYE